MTNQIVTLKGADRVRRRPGVIFGSADSAGVMAAVEMLLDILAEEGKNGFCHQIIITHHRDDSVALQDDGRGIFLGNAADADDTVWRNLFCELFAGPAYACQLPQGSVFDARTRADGDGAGSLELCAVQYASEYMDVRAVRDGFRCELHFEKGENIGGLTRTPSTEPAGTRIRFRPDPDVFCDVSLPDGKLAEKARALALQIPGLKMLLRRETEAGTEETKYFYPGGIGDYLAEPGREDTVFSPVYTAELAAEGRERYNTPSYAARVKVGLCFAENAGSAGCYHNLRELPCGGTHRDIFVAEIAKYLGWVLGRRVEEAEVLRHMRFVIVTEARHTCWTNGARVSIENKLIRDLTQDTLGEDFRCFAKQNKELLDKLF